MPEVICQYCQRPNQFKDYEVSKRCGNCGHVNEVEIGEEKLSQAQKYYYSRVDVSDLEYNAGFIMMATNFHPLAVQSKALCLYLKTVSSIVTWWNEIPEEVYASFDEMHEVIVLEFINGEIKVRGRE